MPTPTEIKAARLSAGLTQTEFGALFGVKLRVVQYWEKGERNLNPVTFALVMASLPANTSGPLASTQTQAPGQNG